MSNNDDDNDRKIMLFPDLEKRRKIQERKVLELRAANDSKTKHEPIFNLPPAIKWLCVATVIPFAVMQFLTVPTNDQIVLAGGFIPARYTGGMEFGWQGIISPLTHMFLHGGWLHILMNVGMVMAFGAGLERAVGGRKLLIIYFASGLIGALTHLAFYHNLQAPMIGASGAASGLFGAILMMMHQNGAMGTGYRTLLPFIAIWIGVSLFFGFVGVPGNDSPIAWTTHVGGFIGGLLLFKPVQKLK